MRVLLAEFVTAGGFVTASGLPDAPPPSLAREGRAMFDAVRTDLESLTSAKVIELDDTPDVPFLERLERTLPAVDAAFVVAPEFDGHLAAARRAVDRGGVRWLGCSLAAIELCTDKRRLAEHLVEAGVPTIPTMAADAGIAPPWPPPWVTKPRDGAGSLGIETHESPATVRGDHTIVQPLVVGTALSVGVLFGPSGRTYETLPPAAQHLGDDGAFEYRGGRVPWPTPTAWRPAVDVVERAITAIPGLGGYVGFDLVLPDVDQGEPLVVEVNPRLTTSYLGYRRLTSENPARRLFSDDAEHIAWLDGTIAFQPNGEFRFSPPSETNA